MPEQPESGFFRQLYGELPPETKGLGLVLGVALIAIFPIAKSFGFKGYLAALGFLALISILMTITVARKRREERISERKFELPFEVLENISSVTPRLVGIIKEELSRHGSVKICNMALDMETVVPWLNYELLDNEGIMNVEFQALIINPDPPDPALRQMIDGKGGNVRASTAKESINILLHLADDPRLNTKGLRLELRTYNWPPLFHGFLVADRHLFISFVEIEGGRLRGANFPYLYLRFETNPKWVRHYFSFYSKWFSFYWQQGATVARSSGE